MPKTRRKSAALKNNPPPVREVTADRKAEQPKLEDDDPHNIDTKKITINIYIPTAAETSRGPKKRKKDTVVPQLIVILWASDDDDTFTGLQPSTTKDHQRSSRSDDDVPKQLFYNNCCPFCEDKLWPSANEEQRSARTTLFPDVVKAHFKRYHADNFAFTSNFDETLDRKMDKGGLAIEATNRNEHYKEGCLATQKPKRIYHFPRGGAPIQDGQYDRDMDDESTDSWYADYREWQLDDFTDLYEKERRFFKLWNNFVLKDVRRVQSDFSIIPRQCRDFIETHAKELQDVDEECYLLLIRLWENRKLTGIHFQKLLYFYERKARPGMSEHALRLDKELQQKLEAEGERKPVKSEQTHHTTSASAPMKPAQATQQPQIAQSSKTEQVNEPPRTQAQGTAEDPITLD